MDYRQDNNTSSQMDCDPPATAARRGTEFLPPPPPSSLNKQTRRLHTSFPPRPSSIPQQQQQQQQIQQQGQPGIAKVAIPKVTTSDSSRLRRRSARACESCRHRKIKCNGNKPTCRQCVEHGQTCRYVDIKRVRDQKELGLLAKQVERYEELLRTLVPEVDALTAGQIRKTLRHFRPGEEEDSDSYVGTLEELDLIDEDLNRNERSRATGFFGKTSEVSWMQKLEDSAERQGHGSFSNQAGSVCDRISNDPNLISMGGGSNPLNAMSYHLDDLNISVVGPVDPYAVPTKEVADRFFNAYMASVHPSFAVIRRTTFTTQYELFWRDRTRPNRRWLAILNMIFALGCRCCRLAGQEHTDRHEGDAEAEAEAQSEAGGQGEGEQLKNEDDHIFLTRARMLSLNGSVLFEHPDLQQIQVEFLVAFYLMAIGQINRASKISSMAFRSAISLGINLRLVDNRTHDGSKEARGRLWWSLYVLEHLLTAITGRVSGLTEGLSSVSVPVPYEEEIFDTPVVQRLFQDGAWRETCLKPTLFEAEDEEGQVTAEWLAGCDPGPSLFFFLAVDLAMITQAIINRIYSIEGLRDKGSQVESRILRFDARLDSWLRKVPDAYRFTNGTTTTTTTTAADAARLSSSRERVTLAMGYYSARITLYRPCLTSSTRLVLGSSSSGTAVPVPAPVPSPVPSKFKMAKAVICLQSACALISTLPDEPDVSWLAHTTPWWNVLHYLMQATTALLLGLSSSSSADTALSSSTILEHVKKAIRWLYQLGVSHAASRRAFNLCAGFLRRLAPVLRVDVSDLPSAGSSVSTDTPSSSSIPESPFSEVDVIDDAFRQFVSN
ncbi:hypothetical protein ASPZODRAFT_130073 [Penicilliopsis zonata CBS 506.65]|uniref:Zn(2)-C6 fungal-type domain-containing protein n=1 Tax=Penicilliopsis zonata CBS 506.65 TaxID=1073090 RepID=A0A1L9SLP1_9EURO|nr:hypothetical protein ASPZODRAFT_130073 [Penicilliopsis zonata CBS 506.65]OJJ48135.1 hypothetical protein ASPZODRAFT_130073 [Penicilliopsis zonata CBS 506.65]